MYLLSFSGHIIIIHLWSFMTLKEKKKKTTFRISFLSCKMGRLLWKLNYGKGLLSPRPAFDKRKRCYSCH